MDNKSRPITTDYLIALKESSDKKKSYIYAGVAVIASILLIFFAIKPTLSTITTIKKDIKTKKTTVAVLDARISALQQLDKEYANNTKLFNMLPLLFPSNSNNSLLLYNINDIVQKNGFLLNNISFTGYDHGFSVATNVLKPVTVNLNVIGPSSDLTSIEKLLKAFEAMPMYPVVYAMSYSPDENSDKTSYSIALRILGINDINFYND